MSTVLVSMNIFRIRWIICTFLESPYNIISKYMNNLRYQKKEFKEIVNTNDIFHFFLICKYIFLKFIFNKINNSNKYENIWFHTCRKRGLYAQKRNIECAKERINFDISKNIGREKSFLPEIKVWNSKKLFFTISWNVKKTCKKYIIRGPKS